MARIAERLRIQAGEVILREGRLGREFFVILEGTATVTRGHVVNILHAGDYFGELAAIEAVPRSATVEATTDSKSHRRPAGVRVDDGDSRLPQRAAQRMSRRTAKRTTGWPPPEEQTRSGQASPTGTARPTERIRLARPPGAPTLQAHGARRLSACAAAPPRGLSCAGRGGEGPGQLDFRRGHEGR